jgi:hypothetical protein
MYRKKYRAYRVWNFALSDSHWVSWNLSPMDKEGLLYNFPAKFVFLLYEVIRKSIDLHRGKKLLI